jgi:hypothetical protein
VNRTYEAWADPDDDGVGFFRGGTVEEARKKGLLGPNATLLYRFEAATLEEASAIHALRMGWQPYRPIGESAPCPRCGAWFYPEGSGECWRCGDPLE